jgi:hypothetical protein
VNITVHIHDSWVAAVPHGLARVLTGLAALERPREPGEDLDDLTELLSGLDEPEASAPPVPPAAALARPPAPQPSPATLPAREWDGVPRTGPALYRWSCNRKALPDVNRVGKSFGYPKKVVDWSDDQVAAAYAVLTSEPAAVNGQAR